MNIAISLTSSMNVGQEYIDFTHKFAKLFASEEFGIVYGGTDYGMMGELAKTYKDNGGKNLVGIMAKDLKNVTKGYRSFEKLDHSFTVSTMEERKKKMAEFADGFFILPGGYGTFEEIGTILGGNANKLFNKPIVIFNYKGFYNKLIDFFNEMVNKKFSKVLLDDIVLVTDSVDEVLNHFYKYKKVIVPDKFIR